MAHIVKEEEYFTRLTLEQKKKAEEERHKRTVDEEKKRTRELHYMRCPKCGNELTEVDHRTVKVDKCYRCNGLWLDAGELEMISKLDHTVLSGLVDIFRKKDHR